MLEEAQWREFIKDYAECENHPGIYILGCFARHVTLYSQQVRALNLVYGLYAIGELKAGEQVVVIGAGAAGLMAAAAAAYLQCKVTLLEEMEGPMELQRNNRQRWIHPHIYDWPKFDSVGKSVGKDRADLPLLDWTPGYAENVAHQIEKKWEESLKQNPANAIYSVRNLRLQPQSAAKETGSRYALSWNGHPGGGKIAYLNHIIVAVGFGLEPRSIARDSYWTEDDTDGSFRNQEDQRWLVSGFGDGALTDLMRLCIHRFRHAEIAGLFDNTTGIHGVIEDLKRIHSDPHISDEDLSRSFSELAAVGLENIVRERLRKHGPNVGLTGQHPHLYSRGSSVLNRLIVLLLFRLNAFEYIPGPTGTITQEGDKFRVEFRSSGKIEVFDRVILRHGPDPQIYKFSQMCLAGHSFEGLKEVWSKLSPATDLSRRPQWPPGFFGPEGEVLLVAGADADRKFADAVSRFGVKIANLTYFKEVRDDGSSTVTYSVEGITATGRDLSGVHFYYESIAGKIGPPTLDPSSERQGMEWFPDDPPELPDTSMDALEDKVRKLSGTVRFKKPLTPYDPPLSFTLRIIILNGDALSKWEFDQLYKPADRVHMDGQKLKGPMEYFARIVWCPVENLKIQLTLPQNRHFKTPTCSVFQLPDASPIAAEEVVHGSTLQMYPPTKWQPKTVKWGKQETTGTEGSLRVSSSSAQTWELSVQRPQVGSCYSLDWGLSQARNHPELTQLADKAKDLRFALLRYRDARRDKLTLPAHQKQKVRSLFLKLHSDIAALQKESGVNEKFDVAFMTYNDFAVGEDRKYRLEFVDGTAAGGEPSPDLWKFWLPFGLGLAGACFKQGDRTYVYLGRYVDEKEIAPEYYLPIPGGKQHSSMVAVPVDHPEWYESMAKKGFDRSRQCIGVIDISVGSRSRWFDIIRRSKYSEIIKLRPICQNFCDRIAGVLG
jgi:HI0933-like protein